MDQNLIFISYETKNKIVMYKLEAENKIRQVRNTDHY